ncbi:MAG: hypothetical protein HC910_20815 [Spirulinaceae cyanobacterium SM2_1_0]|nr:hypothetical protein [Spirulinaceae cyanobacterium SM2_1_0]
MVRPLQRANIAFLPLSTTVLLTLTLGSVGARLLNAAFPASGDRPMLLGDGYTPPDNGGPDSSQGSGTRWLAPMPTEPIL